MGSVVVFSGLLLRSAVAVARQAGDRTPPVMIAKCVPLLAAASSDELNPSLIVLNWPRLEIRHLMALGREEDEVPTHCVSETFSDLVSCPCTATTPIPSALQRPISSAVWSVQQNVEVSVHLKCFSILRSIATTVCGGAFHVTFSCRTSFITQCPTTCMAAQH